MRRSLILLLLPLLCGATITGDTQIRGPFLLKDQAVADAFVSLAESTTFGPSGTIVDLTGRFSAPEYIPRPDTSGWTEYSDFRDDTCSSDNTTIDAIVTQANSASDQVIYLPDDCLVKMMLEPLTGSAGLKTLAYNSGSGNNVDRVWVGCHASADPDLCGFDGDLLAPTVGQVEWRWASGDVESASPLQRYPFNIAQGRSTGISGESCTWVADGTIGSKRVNLDGCAAMSDWAAGDIVRLDSSGDPDTNGDWDWMTRITCVDGPTAGPGDRVGTACDELTDDDQIQIRDALPKNYDGTYYWGAETGHTAVLLERVGSGRGGAGTETHNVSEDFWFGNVNFHLQHDELFSQSAPYIIFRDAFDSGILDSTFHDCAGQCIQFAGSGNNASAILIEGNDFIDEIWDNNCFSEVTGVTAANPVVITALDGCQNGDQYVEFSEDVAEPALAGKSFIKGTTTDNGDGTISFPLTGVDGTGYDTSAGGIVAQQDAYGMALSYCNFFASNVQWINNAMVGTRMGPLIQQGCAGHVAVANYIKGGLDHPGSRGFFSHGNGSAPGMLAEANDFDLPLTTLANSNAYLGEGTNVTFYKNRGQDYGQIQWPPGTSTSNVQGGISGALLVAEQPDQGGTSNEDWNIIGNAFTDISSTNSLIDCADNGGNSACTVVAPYLLHTLAWYRNRAVGSGANLDDNFDSSSTANPTTLSDIDGSNVYESATVPGGWSSEVGLEPTSLFFDAKPSWWCNEAVTFGQIGAYYDNFSGTLGKLPAQIRYEGGTCTLP